MSFTPPITVLPGQFMADTDWNTYVRDNLNALKGFIPTGFSGVHLRTHPDADKAANQVALLACEQIVMNDGMRYTNVPFLTADITLSGAGGLDTGSRAASTWYEVYAIGKSSTGAVADLALLFHRAKSYKIDASQAAHDTSSGLRVGASTTAIGQTFKAGYANVRFADIYVSRNGAVSGHIWCELQTVSGAVLQTSDVLDASNVSTTIQQIRFPFRSLGALTVGTTYRLAFKGDYTISASNYIQWYAYSMGGYADGTSQIFDGTSWSDITADYAFAVFTELAAADITGTLPDGYDQYCQIGWAYNNGSGAIRLFDARDRSVSYLESQIALASVTTANLPILVDASSYLPPVTLIALVAAQNGTVGDSAEISGVPEGYNGFGALYPGGSFRFYQISTTNLYSVLYPLKTELQGLYLSCGAGTGYAYVGGYLW